MRCRPNFTTLPMPELRLYHSPMKCAKFLKRHRIPFEPIDGADAETWTFSDKTGPYAVVLYDANPQAECGNDIGMLAHEATHVMLYALGSIGEDEPAEEEMCYVTQAVTQWLCEAHSEWKERRLVLE